MSESSAVSAGFASSTFALATVCKSTSPHCHGTLPAVHAKSPERAAASWMDLMAALVSFFSVSNRLPRSNWMPPCCGPRCGRAR